MSAVETMSYKRIGCDAIFDKNIIVCILNIFITKYLIKNKIRIKNTRTVMHRDQMSGKGMPNNAYSHNHPYHTTGHLSLVASSGQFVSGHFPHPVLSLPLERRFETNMDKTLLFDMYLG